ncbi:MAG: hypothetical protein BWY19_00616 [bacterium ADurb.Bin212]|nr:MAG: hypothetical protein BWY19_00616 [bacterium ADurb.Bin212]
MNGNFLDKLFSYYDSYMATLSVEYQLLISVFLLLFFVWNIYAFVKSGHWILIAVLIAALPGTWPAAKTLAIIIWSLLKGLFYRIFT